MRFYVGLHQPSNAALFERCFISINRIRDRRSAFPAREWIMDSGAFSEIDTYGAYRHTPEEYAAHVNRWYELSGRTMVAAVSQDFMCEPFILKKWGRTVAEHQAWTVERYDRIRAAVPDAYVMPVLQGYTPEEYVDHIRQYGDRLTPGMWVGVGSVCKRNGNPRAIEDVLLAIHAERRDLRIHGFGLKKTAVTSGLVWQLLDTADSLAWSQRARKARRHPRRPGDELRSGNDPKEAVRYVRDIYAKPVQFGLVLPPARRGAA